MVTLKHIYSDVQQSVDPNLEGNLIYFSVEPHGLTVGDKIRIQTVEGNDYSTNEAKVLWADENIMFVTDQKNYAGTGMGVFAKKESLIAKIAFPAVASVLLYFLFKNKNN